MDLVAASPEAALVDKPGGIFVRRGEQMSEEDRALLQTVARVVLLDDAGTLPEQVERRGRTELSDSRFSNRRAAGPSLPTAPSCRSATWRSSTAWAASAATAASTSCILGPGQTTPAPWVNVIANPQFGTVVSESGSAYTWAENSHEFRLTPWYNDPVTDASGEALYHPRRGNGPLLVALAAAGPRPQPVRRPPRLRLQHLRVRRGRHRHRAVRLCRHRRAREVRPAQDHQPLRPATPAVGDRLLGIGARRTARQDR